ncbi:uncharacterized protein LOC112049329 [Bicyclus anynana]|uniref:Lysosome-associated membrane glycoprotein 5 n=1 Tax=Bicyclus anynana TaxID=110368 RepID=A0A6J1N525_BICAN|nr:uncharacterized protein LOC112049329 [Bicyclus anynana]
MARLSFYLLAAVLCSLTVLGQGNVTKDGAPVTITVPALTSTEPTAKPDTPKTTPEKITTTTTPKTTTTETTTTTEKTTTTTTTTTTTPSPTPEPPKPTPPPTPAPTPAPGPTPAPKQGKWWYKDSNNVTCVVVQFAAQLNVTYAKAPSLMYFVVNVSPNATVVDGNCSDSNQWLTLSWPVNNQTANVSYNNMVLYFHKNETTKQYSLKNLNVSLAPEMFPNSSNTNASVDFWHGEEWTTPLSTSYRCAAPVQLNLTSDAAAAVLTISQLQEEAFRAAADQSFSVARECSGADVPDAVPIAVGCALGALVVVVLVAYLVARRRSAAQGYLSM